MKIFFLLFAVTLLFNLPSVAKQHSTIQKIIEQSKYCQPNFYFSKEDIESSDKNLRFLDKTALLLNYKKADYWYFHSKEMNLIPLNLCALRGNKKYYKDENKRFLRELRISTIINLDFLAHTKVKGKTIGFKYLFTPITPSAYPTGESIKLLLHALTALSEATPEERVYISCFSGKHRTSLLSAMYQFLGEYSNHLIDACNNAANDKDKGYLQAELIANQGILTYNMPSKYKEFYEDFTKAVCEEKSEEFFQNLI
ncbi:MAG: hypothetical protein QNJ31_06370 [Candidatus Caenarcaniphilales bacterium]|nr:hypothetical protein [Candidatus Caenarcaniphilales bacterium]